MSTKVDALDLTIEKTNILLKEIEQDFGWIERRSQVYHALRTVMHALRDRLPVDDSVNFASQLPLLLKGIYFDGWDSNIVPIKMNRQEFIQRIANEFPLEVEGGVERLINLVGNRLFAIVDPNEAEKVISSLPEDLGDLFFS